MSTPLRTRALLPAALLVALATPAAAAAATKPTASTGTATTITPSSATLRGTVNPQGAETSYSFQYGPTTSYGAGTPPVPIGKDTKAKPVSAAIGGLAPATTYHFRVVATNGVGTVRGADRTFKTAKQPLGLTLEASPNPVRYAGPVTLQGTLSGTDNSGRQIVLQSKAFPYTADFAQVGNPQVTGSTGTFAFPILSLTTNTQFRVQIPGRSVASPIVTALVPVTVGTRVSATRVRRGRSITFSGTITPMRPMGNVAVQKLRDGRWITVAGSVARPFQSSRSRYSVKVRIPRGGSYRVFAGSGDGDLANNVGRTVKVRSYR